MHYLNESVVVLFKNDHTVEQLAEKVDIYYDSNPPTVEVAAVAQPHPTPETSDDASLLTDLKMQIAAINAKLDSRTCDRRRRPSRSRPCSRSPHPRRDYRLARNFKPERQLCHYHYCLGSNVKKCMPGCARSPSSN